MNNNRSIVIVGAPRSGTSLMQKILRESPGARSVPHESSIIWNKFIRPEINDWKFEGANPSNLSNHDKESLRQEFDDKAMTFNQWKLWSQLGLMKNPWLATSVRWLYPKLFPLLSIIRVSGNAKGRLIEKTVHGGLWMELIDEILNQPIFIHITRDGQDTIQSITNAWTQSERFGCYQVPEKILYQHKTFQTTWCFPLIENWETLCDKPIYQIATFQWMQIQEQILKYSHEQIPSTRLIRIKLEDLTTNPDILIDLLNKLEIPITDSFEKLSYKLPRVNESERNSINLDINEQSWITQQIEEIQKQLGY